MHDFTVYLFIADLMRKTNHFITPDHLVIKKYYKLNK